MSGGGAFQSAVLAARESFATLDREGRLMHAALRWDDLIDLWGKRKIRTLIAIWDSTPADKREDKARLIADRAYKDPLHFHVARGFLAEMTDRGEVLPTPLRLWAAQLIAGSAEKPPSKRPDTDHKRRNRALILGLLVHRVAADFSISATRGSASDPRSACDAVSIAWHDHVRELPPDRRDRFTIYSYERVRDFYYEAKEIALRENAQLRAFMNWLESRPPAP